MEPKVLVEVIDDAQLQLVETTGEPLPKGVLARVKGQFGYTEKYNRNKRRYSNDVWGPTLEEDADFRERLQNRNLFGEADHPQELNVSIPRVSHCITSLVLDRSTNTIMGEADILDTPMGRIVNTLLEYGAKIGISSRAAGKLIPNKNGTFEVDKNTFKYITHDFVTNPSNEGSWPAKVTEGFMQLIESDHAEYAKDPEFYADFFKQFDISLEEAEAKLREEAGEEVAEEEDLREELEELQKENDSLVLHTQALKECIDIERDKNRGLRKDLAEFSTLNDEYIIMVRTLEEANTQLNTIKREHAELEVSFKELEENGNSSQEVIEDFQRVIEEAHAQIEELEGKLEVVSKALSESRSKELASQNRILVLQKSVEEAKALKESAPPASVKPESSSFSSDSLKPIEVDGVEVVNEEEEAGSPADTETSSRSRRILGRLYPERTDNG